MGMIGTVGRTALGLGAGALGVLAGIKVFDDRRVDSIWQTLEEAEAPGQPFTEDMVAGLPEPARRYFLHAIRPGTPLATRVRFSYTGEIKVNEAMGWMPLSVNQILVKGHGFVWKAKVTKGPMVLTGADHYFHGDGRMRIALYGLVPVVNATGPDLSRSALARLLMEGALLPTSVLPAPNVRIEGVDESRFTATVDLHGQSTPLTFNVDEEGRLKDLTLPRWGNLTPDRSFRYIPYGIVAEEERTVDGYTIPAKIRAGWWYGTEQYDDVIRLTMDHMEFE
jgi:hypothetical protein